MPKKQVKTKQEKKPGFFETLLGPDPRDEEYEEDEETSQQSMEEEEAPEEEPVESKPANKDRRQTKKQPKPKKEEAEKQPKLKRGSCLWQMKLKYFCAVIFIYILTFFALYGIASIFLTIWPVHPYLNLIIVVLILAISAALSAHIANSRLQSHWLRHQD
ncbi:MAG: hypothetical protein LKF79_07285 [Solobacterium sp.]|jgi:uncharacterized integral membrane protein|nr:hypothetical protein [Solobacterium sp.]MCH4222193.1 hypothetical protein [Solobacterium sp.]MCH4266429.1 hypothetical protein [Solobacterium sp.]